MGVGGVPMTEIQFVLQHQTMTTKNGFIRRLGFSNNPLEGLFGGEKQAVLQTAANGKRKQRSRGDYTRFYTRPGLQHSPCGQVFDLAGVPKGI